MIAKKERGEEQQFLKRGRCKKKNNPFSRNLLNNLWSSIDEAD